MIVQTKSLLGMRDKNEDEIDVIMNYDNNDDKIKEINFYAIYDGHGGNMISKYIKERLSKYFISKVSDIEMNKSKTCNKNICNVYEHLQRKITELSLNGKVCGSTALTIIHYAKNNIYSQLKIINLGDCRSVLCRCDNMAVALTKDHKPTSYDEHKRIKKLGGEIIHEKNDDPRINGLSVSRSFGDIEAKPHVSHIPEIFDYELTTKGNDILDKFLILACDGVWDVLSNQEAVDFVLFKLDEIKHITNCNLSGKNNIANLLGKYAIDKGSMDNISVAIIFFNNIL